MVSEDQRVTDWLGSFFSSTNCMSAAQATVVRAFGLGTGAWALWLDLDRKKVRIRHYDARMVIPLTWDEDGVTECAFVTRAFYRGKAVDQLQMHLRGEIDEVKAQGESDRIDFKLQLAGVRNVKAARALLADHDKNELIHSKRRLNACAFSLRTCQRARPLNARSVDKLKEAEPWLFEAGGKHAKGGNGGSGTTGLPNAGAASDEGKTLKHWREIAGLTDDDDEKKEG